MTSEEYRTQSQQALQLLRQRNYTAALEIVENLHQEIPERYAPLFVKAVCHAELEQVYDSEQAFQKCLAQHPHKVDTRYHYAMFLANQGYFRDAIVQFHKCITDGYDTCDVRLYLACAYIQIEDDFANAREHVKISLCKKLTRDGIQVLVKTYEMLFWKKLYRA